VIRCNGWQDVYIVDENEGIVYKRLAKTEKMHWCFIQDNAYYKPYEVKASEILEIWEFACSLLPKVWT
jgi:hypothetical protein